MSKYNIGQSKIGHYERVADDIHIALSLLFRKRRGQFSKKEAINALMIMGVGKDDIRSLCRFLLELIEEE
jgi:hypothetical protein